MTERETYKAEVITLADRRAPLKPGGGDGTFDGMEPRIAALEAHMTHVQADVATLKADVKEVRTDIGTLKTDLGKLTVKVEHLPSKGFIVTSALGSLAVIAALIAFSDKIQHLVGH